MGILAHDCNRGIIVSLAGRSVHPYEIFRYYAEIFTVAHMNILAAPLPRP